MIVDLWIVGATAAAATTAAAAGEEATIWCRQAKRRANIHSGTAVIAAGMKEEKGERDGRREFGFVFHSLSLSLSLQLPGPPREASKQANRDRPAAVQQRQVDRKRKKQ